MSELDLNKLVDLYGLNGAIVAIAIVIVSGIIKSKWFESIWSKLTDKIIEYFLKKKSTSDEVKHIDESDILNHDIFNYIDLWTYSKVPTLQFSTEYRTIVFRKYLSIYLKCYKKILSGFVKDGKYKTMGQAELWKSLLDLINQVICEYEKECKEMNIPDIVISKMKMKNNESIQLTIDLINNISNSQFYESENNYLKIYSILNIILSVLENTISNSETICNSINGQLRGLKINDSGKDVIEP
jgi:hypothetical protein